MPDRNDGGAWALLGYLYQILGSGALTSVSVEAADENLTDVIVELEEMGRTPF